MAIERFEVRKDIHLFVLWIFIVVQASAVGDISVFEMELNFIILAHIKNVHRQINPVSFKFNLA